MTPTPPPGACDISEVWVTHRQTYSPSLVGWLVVLWINVDLAIFQPYLDLEAGDNQSLKIQVARPGIEPRSSCSANQELNHSATTAPPSLVTVSPPKLIIALFKWAGHNYGQPDRWTDEQTGKRTDRRMIWLLDAPGGSFRPGHKKLWLNTYFNFKHI